MYLKLCFIGSTAMNRDRITVGQKYAAYDFDTARTMLKIAGLGGFTKSRLGIEAITFLRRQTWDRLSSGCVVCYDSQELNRYVLVKSGRLKRYIPIPVFRMVFYKEED